MSRVAQWLLPLRNRPGLLAKTVAAGLTLDAGKVSLAVVARKRRGIRLLTWTGVPVSGDDPESQRLALRQLRQQVTGYLPPLILGLDGPALGYLCLPLPHPRPADLPAWVVARFGEHLPPGISPAQITLDFRLIRGRKRHHVQVIYARRGVVNRMVERVAAAGFQVAAVYPRCLAEIESVRATPTPDETLVFVGSDAITLIQTEDGIPLCFHELAWGDENGPDKGDPQRLTTRISQLQKEGQAGVTLVTTTNPGRSAGRPDSVVCLGQALSRPGLTLSRQSTEAAAIALAQRGLNRADELLNLSPTADPDLLRQDRIRRLALRVGFWGGAGILLLGITLLGLQIHYSQIHSHLKATLAEHRSRVAELQALLATEEALREEVTALNTLVQSRSATGPLLQALAQAVPESLWLRTLGIKRTDRAGTYRIVMSGLAWEEQSLVAFIRRLEQRAPFERIATLTTERLDAGTVWRQTARLRVPLLRFELICLARL